MMITENSLPSSKSALLQSRNTDNQPIITVKCSGKNKVKQMCVNDACQQKRAFTCFDLSCKCQAEHDKCFKGDVFYVAKEIHEKGKGSTAQIKEEINKKFDDIIDQLSECRDTLLAKIVEMDDLIKFCTLSDTQCKFIEIVENENEQNNKKEFTGKQGRYVWETAKGKTKKSIKLFEDIRAELDKLETEWVGLKCLHEQRIAQAYQQFEATENKILLKRTVKMPKNKVFVSEEIVKNSAIVKKQSEAETFLSFFPRQVIDIKLLFRASQYEFSLKSYFENCGNLPKTVFIIKTNKDKVIGAYSPLAHSYTGKGYQTYEHGEYEHDPSRESFIFSVTNGDKFELKKEFRAIFRPKDNGSVCFGDELIIGQGNNKEGVGWTKPSKCYQNQKYRKTDPKFYEMLNGNEGDKFEIREWEVWQVEMKA